MKRPARPRRGFPEKRFPASPRWEWKRFFRNRFRRRRCAANWSNFSMARLTRLFCFTPLLFHLSWPAFSIAQTTPELAGIVERLDRLERENRTLSEEVRSLRAELASSNPVGRPPDAATAQADVETPPAPPTLTVEERLDIQQHRLEEQAQ